MNFWATGQIPYSWKPGNVTTAWQGTDNIKNLAANPEADIWQNVDIGYQYNAQGFRTYDLNSLLGQPVDVALGCSFTEGIGLPAHQSWPSLIEQQRGLTMLNLGLGSGTTDTVARILCNIAGLYDIQAVFILWPYWERFEVYTTDSVKTIMPYNAQTHHIWNMDADVSEQRYQRNKNTVAMLSTIHKFSVSEMSARQVTDEFIQDRARDGTHAGPLSNVRLSEIFLDSLTQ
jgi:hypothetical protein